MQNGHWTSSVGRDNLTSVQIVTILQSEPLDMTAKCSQYVLTNSKYHGLHMRSNTHFAVSTYEFLVLGIYTFGFV